MPNKPNFIIVMTDQQRADLRRGAGYSLDTMPFLDEWAGGGIDFARAYTTNPTCMPARVSMFNGRYSESHRVRTNHNMPDALYTEDLLDVLKKAGYVTALCGKNHSHRPNKDFDFCEACGHLGNEGEANSTPDEKEFADFLCATRHMESHSPSPGGTEVQHPYRNVSSALKFIDSLDGKTPFFAWVSFAEPHNPYQVPEEYFDLFPPEDLPDIAALGFDISQKGARFAWLRQVWEKVLGSDIDNRILRARSNYHGMLRLIDDQFRRLIEGLRKRRLEQDTVVIFLSDHGDFVGEYGLIRKGPDLPDLLTRIPMVWRGPGIAAQGRRENEFVSIADLLPTICDMIGASAPLGCQGKSILPVLQDGQIPQGEFDFAYAESGFGGLYWTKEDNLTLWDEGAASESLDRFDCLNTWTQCGQVRALWSGDWHIQIDMLGNGFLYNLSDDRYELRNLWDVPEFDGEKTRLLAGLAAAMLRAADPLPLPRRRYRAKVHPKGYWFQRFDCADPGVGGKD